MQIGFWACLVWGAAGGLSVHLADVAIALKLSDDREPIMSRFRFFALAAIVAFLGGLIATSFSQGITRYYEAVWLGMVGASPIVMDRLAGSRIGRKSVKKVWAVADALRSLGGKNGEGDK